jgi:hypothetical protein
MVYIFYTFSIDSYMMIISALDPVTSIQDAMRCFIASAAFVASATTFIASAATQLPAYTSNINLRFLRCISTWTASMLAAGVGGDRSRSVASMSPSDLRLHLGIEAGSLWAECHIFIPQIAGVLVII